MNTAPSKILVIDDEPHFERLIRQRFRKQIRQNEYDFIFAENGRVALEQITNTSDIDLILSDINMPQMDGLTFLTRLNEQQIPVKTVMVSAYGDMKNIRTAMNQGAYDFVTKPINFEDLEITIQKGIREVQAIRLAEKNRLQLDHLHQELAVASEIQQSILPQHFSIFEQGLPFRLHAEMIPAKEVGGDFFDAFYIDKDHLAMVIGDVSGKGMPAALFMAVSRTLLKATGLKERSVSDCLQQVNTLLCQDNAAYMFVTVFYGVLNIRTGELEYSSGGHNPPWLLFPNGSTQYLDNCQNVALGIVDDWEYTSKTFQLPSGASLIMYTDGITEAMNKEQDFFGDQRLVACLGQHPLTSPKELIEEVLREVGQFADGALPSDDITIMSLQHLQGDE